VFALLVEAAPAVGGDLTAQAWWASWAGSNGAPVDLGWYGGVPVASYSPRWSSLEGPRGCVRPGNRQGWTTLVADRPGRYVLTSSWRPTGRCG
jgi:hypothetical protein